MRRDCRHIRLTRIVNNPIAAAVMPQQISIYKYMQLLLSCRLSMPCGQPPKESFSHTDSIDTCAASATRAREKPKQ